jgi:hypothetical protein
MFLRFSKIYNNNKFKTNIKKIILKYIETIFKNIPEIIFLIHENILEKIIDFHEVENRDLVCFF